MREIKFRAWNKKKKVMVYNNEDDSSDYWDGVDVSDIEMVNHRLKDRDVYKWMQYTGLKDKNGKEIYEGDIWKLNDTVCVAEFKFTGWHLTYISGPVQYPYAYSRAIEGEIIGNIYENPEMLDKPNH